MATPPQLHLALHVRACQCNGQVILLDLRRGRYLGVGGRSLPALARAIEGWPESTQPVRHQEPQDLEPLTAPLVRQGLLTGKPVARSPQPFLPRATASLDGEDDHHEATTGPRRVLRFTLSASSASLSLRHCSLLSIADRVRARRARLQQRCPTASPQALRDAVGAYQKLRPLYFTARERCLHDSLALLHFLASEGVLATWVLGVRIGPFAAHAWVQSGEIVLSDQHEHVRGFQPILTV